MRQAIGVDLGGTKTATALVGADGTLGEISTAPTPSGVGPEAVLDTVASLVAPLLGPDVVGVGIGTAGVVDSTTGRIVSATETFASWVGTDLVAGIRSRLGRGDDFPIEVRNDVDAHALGESWLGAGAGHQSMLMVAVGTGVGGAVILGDKLWTGAHHVAGEMGHVPVPGAHGMRCPCGRPGHLEAVAAGPAIERRYLEVTGEVASGREIMGLATEGDPAAVAVVDAAAEALGRAIAGIVTVLDPSCVVIGGGVAQAGEVWWEPLLRTCRAELVDVLQATQILPARLGTSAALLGAAHTILEGAS
ncbi:glucokinase [Tessaracoccus bendigoensis DSM 12906]|uniref:Glucokinase n=1 Tax=Tessaracoccus bendigoensis DSM 12906 TaxID=1123357 RepID=A0A1M6JW12_9ACTN|nr:ROK family protein [Tessaracoccus bendigoensis]SHJ50901.1 glucokinase [Tessaracoccus bendigoensis DSM 12906]